MATYLEDSGNQNPNQVLELYRKIVEYLNRKVICGDTTGLLQWTTPPLRACIIIQLVAINGLKQPQVAQSQLDFFRSNIITMLICDICHAMVHIWYMIHLNHVKNKMLIDQQVTKISNISKIAKITNL